MPGTRTADDVFQELLTVCNAARDLVAALDRMHGGGTLSVNADAARERLRELVTAPRDERDRFPRATTAPPPF